MMETGFADAAPNPKLALQNYKEAHNLGNTDASINLALFFINGHFQPKDLEQGKSCLIHAYQNKNKRAGALLLQFGFIKSEDELPGLCQEYAREVNMNASKKVAMNSTVRTGQITGGGSSHGVKK